MEITPGLLLRAYAHGLFPMAKSAESDELYWFDPPVRGVLPLDGFHTPRRLRREIRRRERMQRELAEKESLLRLAMDQMSDGIYQLDKDLHFTLFNDRYRELLGVPPDLVQVGSPVSDLVRFLANR